ncbi:hypothetical protein KAW38_00560 [Candidatus Micrarchaeota archaeon]|nr:hypothetical protein [Candidatus Micrarchaeota archaeon]
MKFSSSKQYLKQISLYLKNRDFKKAYSLASEARIKYPGNKLIDYLFAKSLFGLGKYEESLEVVKNLLKKEKNDLFLLLAASNCLYLERYGQGLLYLRQMKHTNEELKFIFRLLSGADLTKNADKKLFSLIEKYTNIFFKEYLE